MFPIFGSVTRILRFLTINIPLLFIGITFLKSPELFTPELKDTLLALTLIYLGLRF